MKETTFASISFSSFLASFRKSIHQCNANNHNQSQSVIESALKDQNQSYRPMLSPFCMTSYNLKTCISGGGLVLSGTSHGTTCAVQHNISPQHLQQNR